MSIGPSHTRNGRDRNLPIAASAAAQDLRAIAHRLTQALFRRRRSVGPSVQRDDELARGETETLENRILPVYNSVTRILRNRAFP